MRQEKIELAQRLLIDADIEAILFKGWSIANYYANRLLRPLGDIDLLVRSKDFAAASELFSRPEAISCWADLHDGLFELKDRSTSDLFDRSQIEIAGAVRVRVLSAEDHLALLAIHLLKHGAWRPVWLCDIAAIVESLPANFDWKICFGSSKRRADWIASSIVLAHKVLGAGIDRVPLTKSQKQVPEWFVDALFEQWGNLFPGDHLPVRPRPLMSQSFKSPRETLKAIGERWPTPIIATFDMHGRINSLPRFPYQLGAFAFRVGNFLWGTLGRAWARP
jgi:hypothetical protein